MSNELGSPEHKLISNVHACSEKHSKLKTTVSRVCVRKKKKKRKKRSGNADLTTNVDVKAISIKPM